MSIFDTDIRHPVEDLLIRAQKVVCDTVRHSLINYHTDPGYLAEQIEWGLEDEGLWLDRDKDKQEEDQIYKKYSGLKLKKRGIAFEYLIIKYLFAGVGHPSFLIRITLSRGTL